MNIGDNINRSKTAVVVVGYNRLASLRRLLSSLETAVYPSSDIPLVISVDASGDIQLYDFVRNYEWGHGNKYVIIHETRLGLKKHIFACGGLTEYFRAVIILEDDLFVSPYYYEYAQRMLDYYEADDKAACIGLYSYASNIFAALPFTPYQTEYDVYGIQVTVTWGECWNRRMWREFQDWLEENPAIDWKSLNIPSNVKNFKKAWSKFFTAYLSEKDRFVVVPYKSYTTNFTEAGEHSKYGNPAVQVPYVHRHEDFRCAPVEKLIKYNSFFNPIGLEKYLPGLDGDVYVNFYGIRENIRGCRYELTTDVLPYRLVKSYSLELKPIEMNVILNLDGTGIYLYDLSQIDRSGKTDPNPVQSIEYRLEMFRPSLLFKFMRHYVFNLVKCHLHI